MKYVDKEKMEKAIPELREYWNTRKPFRYFIYDDILLPEAAEKLLAEYPEPSNGKWDNTTYVNQKNKFSKTEFEPGSAIKEAIDEMNSPEFLKIMEQITGIDELEADPQLFGGGLHQSINGAFLDVHVDFNYHPTTNHHRRMNIIIYMNKDWKKEYNGYLELWDMDKKEQLEYVEPKFNRCVVFETNEISFHGHPKKLNTPEGVSRKSIALYYYTETRPEEEISGDHNTIYVNTEGMKGQVKNFQSGVKAFLERVGLKK